MALLPLQWLYSGHSENYWLSIESEAERTPASSEFKICLPASLQLTDMLYHLVESIYRKSVHMAAGYDRKWNHNWLFIICFSDWKEGRQDVSELVEGLEGTVGLFVCLNILGCIPDSHSNMADKILIYQSIRWMHLSFCLFTICPISVISASLPVPSALLLIPLQLTTANLLRKWQLSLPILFCDCVTECSCVLRT